MVSYATADDSVIGVDSLRFSYVPISLYILYMCVYTCNSDCAIYVYLSFDLTVAMVTMDSAVVRASTSHFIPSLQ